MKSGPTMSTAVSISSGETRKLSKSTPSKRFVYSPDSCVAALFDIGQDGFDGFADVFTFCLIAFGNAANVA